MKKQNGFSLGVVLAVVAVIVVGGLVAWRVWPTSSTPPTSTTGNSQTISSPVDAEKQSQELDDSSLDADLKPSVLDEDIESLL